LYKCRAQKQVFRSIAAQRQFGCQQQTRATCVSLGSSIHHFLDIPVQISDNEIELRNAQFERHEAIIGW